MESKGTRVAGIHRDIHPYRLQNCDYLEVSLNFSNAVVVKTNLEPYACMNVSSPLRQFDGTYNNFSHNGNYETLLTKSSVTTRIM